MSMQLNQSWQEAWQAAQQWVQHHSPWELVFKGGSASQCELELHAVVKHRGPGVLWEGGARQAHLLFCNGPVTEHCRDRLQTIYDDLHSPKYVVAFGTRAISSDAYQSCEQVTTHVDEAIPVDVYVLSFPPRPEALVDAVQALLLPLLTEHAQAISRVAGEDMPAEVVLRRLAQRNAPPTPEELLGDHRLAERPPV